MKYVLSFLLLCLSFCVNAQKLEFTGKLTGLNKNTKVILSDLRPKADLNIKRFHDTATVSNGVFKFNTTIPGTGMYALRIGLVGDEPENRTLYLDAGKVQLTGKRGELKKAVLSGDASYIKDYMRFTNTLEGKEIFARRKAIADTAMMRMAETGSYTGLYRDTAFLARRSKVEREATIKTLEVAREWLTANPDSDINAYIIYTYLRRELDDPVVKKALENLSPSAKKSLTGKGLKKLSTN